MVPGMAPGAFLVDPGRGGPAAVGKNIEEKAQNTGGNLCLRTFRLSHLAGRQQRCAPPPQSSFKVIEIDGLGAGKHAVWLPALAAWAGGALGLTKHPDLKAEEIAHNPGTPAPGPSAFLSRGGRQQHCPPLAKALFKTQRLLSRGKAGR